MLRLVDSRIIAPTAAARCTLARSVLRVGKDYRLVAFRGSDTHVHIEAACNRTDALELARRVETSLSHRLALPVPFERARVKPVRDQQHLGNLLHYCFGQESRHGIDVDPFHTASNLPDLLGMRVVGAYTCDNVRELLPRVSRRKLLRHFGDLEPGRADAVVDLADLAGLTEAAAAAFALPALSGNSRDVVEARRAAVHVACAIQSAAGRVRPDIATISEQLAIGPRAVRNLRRQSPSAQGVRAVTQQLQLRAAIRAAKCRTPHDATLSRTTPADELQGRL